MRGEQEKKQMPMAGIDEAKSEAPGLRVGAGAWKWPPIWPYDGNFFKRKIELDAKSKEANNAMSLLGGVSNPFDIDAASAGGDAAGDGTAKKQGVFFDDLKYWDENKDVKTELDDRVAQRIEK